MVNRKLSIFLSLFFLFIHSTLASTIGPKAQDLQLSESSQVVLDSLWAELDWPQKKLPAPPIIKKKEISPDPILKKKEEIKKTPSIVIKKKKSSPVPQPIIKKVVKKKLSKGQLKIQEMLKANRARLKKRQAKSSRLTPRPKKNESLSQLYRRRLKQMHKSRNDKLTHVKNKRKETFMRWKRKREQFFKNLPYYKENLISFEASPDQTPTALRKKSLKTPVRNDYFLVSKSIQVPIKNQGRRPTCSAFAGVRSIETLLYQNNFNFDLSEQYFYWASKPNCQRYPCRKRGSWVTRGYRHGQKSSLPDLPLEKACPYSQISTTGNETQIPLVSQCRQGSVQVLNYKSINTLDQVYQTLQRNMTVVGGFKLSPNFYKTTGLVTYKDSLIKGKKDSHASGHALLMIGHMKLPPKLRAEGQVCLIVANSWGEGWGQGGFACLTEKWIRHYRIKNAFVAVNKLRVN